MTHLIDKSALVAEIEKRKKRNLLNEGAFEEDIDILSFLDTLEVKEVDLEKYYHDFLQKEWFDKNCNRTMSEMMAFTAKHFFELGLKAQKEYEDDQDTTRPRHEG